MIIIGPSVRFPACRLGIVCYWVSAPTLVGQENLLPPLFRRQQMPKQTKRPLLCSERAIVAIQEPRGILWSSRRNWNEFRVEERKAFLRNFFFPVASMNFLALFLWYGFLREITMEFVTSVHCTSERGLAGENGKAREWLGKSARSSNGR